MSGLQIHIEQLAYRQGDAPVLAELQLQVAPGEFVVALGPSGAGKSSLLNAISGLGPSFHGHISLNGEDLGAKPENIGLGYMFQEPRLMPWLTVLENVTLVLEGREDAEQVAARLLTAVGLQQALHAYPASLSGGMQRRVALARAFSVEPGLLLMDEPFVSLDAPTAAALRDQMLQLWRDSGAAVLMVTHDLREAVSMADRLVFLSSSPATVIHQAEVDLPRPRNIDGRREAAFVQDLLAEHPHLLSGITGGDVLDD